MDYIGNILWFVQRSYLLQDGYSCSYKACTAHCLRGKVAAASECRFPEGTIPEDATQLISFGDPVPGALRRLFQDFGDLRLEASEAGVIH